MQFAAPVHNLPLVLSSVPTLVADLRETRPGFVPAAPRVYEKLSGPWSSGWPRAHRSGGGCAAGPRRRSTGGRGDATARRCLGRSRLQLAVADRLVLSRVRAQLGLDRASAMLSGAAPLQPGVHWFFLALGLDLYEAYGLTETCPGLTTNRPGRVRLGTVGQALPGVELA